MTARLLDRVTDGFVAAQSTAKAFGVTAAFFAVYMTMGQRLPGVPRLPWFDYYPFPFLVTFVSLWAILLGIAVLKTGKVIEAWMEEHIALIETLTDHAIEIQRRQEAHLAHIERLLTSNEEQ